MQASISKANTANRCLRKYAYRYIQKIQNNAPNARPQLGVIGHQALEFHFSDRDWTYPITKYESDLRELLDEERAVYAHIPGDLYRMVRGYLNHWKKIDEDVKTLATELTFVVRTPEGNDYEGIIDRIYEDSSGVWIEDHKFVKAVPEEAVRYLDAQTNMYFYAATKLGYNPVGVVFDYVRTKPPTQPKILKNGTVSRAACDTDLETYISVLKSAGQNPSDYMDIIAGLSKNAYYKRFKVPRPMTLADNVMKDFDDTCKVLTLLADSIDGFAPYPRCVTRDCTWDCEFCNLCFAELTGSNVEAIRQYEYKPVEKRESLTNDGNKNND